MNQSKRWRILRDMKRILSAAAVILVVIGIWLWNYYGQVVTECYVLWLSALGVLAAGACVNMGITAEKRRAVKRVQQAGGFGHTRKEEDSDKFRHRHR